MSDNQNKLTNWVNEPSIEDLKSDLLGGSSAKDIQVSKINNWLDLLNAEGKYKPVKKSGRSTVQPKLARKQAEWRYAALTDPFLSTSDLFDISPRTFKDRRAANENSLILNYQFNIQMDKVKFINEYVRTAVDQGTVIVKVEWIYEERVVTKEIPVYEYVPIVDPMQANTIFEAIAMQEQDPDQFLELPEEIQESVYISASTKQATQAIIVDYVEEGVTEVVRDHPYVSVCDYHNITIDPTCQGDFSKAQFVIHSYETSYADLVKADVYSNLDKIQFPANNSGNHVPLEQDGVSFQFSDDARKKCTVYEYWGFWDIHNDGQTVPVVAAWCNDVMIRMDENPIGELPFEVIAYTPTYKSVYGEPDAALLEENQQIIGAVTRGITDSMARSANSQIGMRKDVLDTVNERKYIAGERYKFNSNIVDVRSAIIEHTYPELPASAFNMLQMFNSEAESITGVRSWSGGESGQGLGNTATAARGILSAASKRELDILRRLASGLERIARKILILNSKFLDDSIVIRITDEQFSNIKRENLKGGFDIKISVSTADTNNIKAQELAFMLQTMGQSLPFDMTKTILSEISKLRNMPDLAKMLDEYSPQPDPIQELELQRMQLENEKLALELEEKRLSIQAAQTKGNLDTAKVDELKAKTDKIRLDTIEQELGVTQERDLEKLKAQAQSNLKRDIVNTAINANTKSKKGETK